MLEIVTLYVETFMVKKVKYLIFFIGLSFHMYPQAMANELKNLYPIKLDIFDGSGSLLLKWSSPDDVYIKEIKIFRRTNLKGEFKLISNIFAKNDNNSKYLDRDCKDGTRYFYYVEVIDKSNKIYKSDDLRPAFGSIRKSKNLETVNLFKSPRDLFRSILKNKLVKKNKDSYEYLISALLKLLYEEPIDLNLWFEKFSLNYVDDIKPIFAEKQEQFFTNDLLLEFQNYGYTYRNHYLLSPKEWDDETSNIFTLAKNNWFLLRDSFKEFVNVIENLPPVIILGSESNLQTENSIKLLVTNNETLEKNNVKLSFLNNEFEIDLSEALPNSLHNYTIPSYWDHVQLNINDKNIDDIMLIDNKKIIKTLNQEIVLNEKNIDLKMSKEHSEIWVNEIFWNANSSSITLELAGANKAMKNYVINVNRKILWEIQFNSSFDIQYVDSTFNLSVEDLENYVVEFCVVENNLVKTIELFKLTSKENLNNHRFPNGGKWMKTENHSFGFENNDSKTSMDTNLIPELFVLYQNFPNPFNGNTRISFDLLQDAILSLYVTDATGRIKTTFSNNEFFNSGKYNFDWNAESFSTGVYFFTINAEVDGYLPIIYSKKMIYLK